MNEKPDAELNDAPAASFANVRTKFGASLRTLRPVLYRRFHLLLPLFALPGARRFWRAMGWMVLVAYFAFAALILTLRYAILPDIEQYRGKLEAVASQAVGLPVHIGGITAGWDGLRPDLTLTAVSVADAAGRPALAFSRIEAILDWSSLLRWQLRLSLLAIDEPVLHVRRTPQGALVIAGISVTEGESRVSEWVLAQKRIRINGATLIWEDELRAAPPLILEDLNLALDNDGDRHRFGLTALPPAELASRIDIRADLTGDDLAVLEEWKGQLYTELDYVDLAGWRNWFDYPVALPQGRGGMRAWLTVAGGQLVNLTTDLALSDVRVQLAKTLPELQLVSLDGRIAGRLRPGGFAASGRNLSLGLADGTVVPPTDFSFDWQKSEEGRAIQGSGTASRMNLERLKHLSAYLPMDDGSRKLLDDYAPTGDISDVRLSFSGDRENLRAYALRANFSGLGLRASGYFPGFSGITGNVDANERGGTLTLRAQGAAIDLPSVFPESRMAFDTLNAQARWKIDGGKVDVDLSKVDFSGQDAAGSASGQYHYSGDGPGTIDLTAALTRARGDAVWRYMPHAVNAGARSWLHSAITQGSASDAVLTLKGNLARFPFLDGSGVFLVTAKAHDVTLNYAPGWPLIEHIDGNLRFAGAGMRIEAQRGSIFGAGIGATVAEIADFDAAEPALSVRGTVDGPTAEFFRFIEASPVGEVLNHATSDMRAVGQGKLDLSLDIPLARLENAKVQGDFRFLDNQIVVDPALPPMTRVNGLLQFTDSSVSVKEISALFLGGPVKVRADTLGGRVDVLATGSLSVAQARRYYDLPVFDRLSGSASWRAEVKVQKTAAQILVDSNLAGITSTLPPPFNKTASDLLPLRFEKGAVAENVQGRSAQRDRMQMTLGRIASAQLIRRRGADGLLVPERGALAIGGPLNLPEKGIAVSVTLPEVDTNFWHEAFSPAAASGEKSGKASAGSDLMPDQVTVVTPVLGVFGQHFRRADLRARRNGGVWTLSLASQEANGDLQFDPTGRGALRARLKNYAVAPSGGNAVHAATPPTLEDIPGLDWIVENFSVGDMKLGRLELKAFNDATSWRIQTLTIANPQGRLEGTGVWRMQAPRQFSMDFTLKADDAGGMLGRLGYPGTLKRGSATLGGKVRWLGVPFSIDYPSLTGELRVDAANGQFAKVDPGAAGKLLGLISLQNLPRRISLDFQDVFSEGFAFDTIASDLSIKAGTMHTDRLQIDGPSARIVMRGDVDLQHETQKLMVNIQPELGGTAALGVALINPIAGAATLLAHKVLQSPLNQAFSFDYSITGSWEDPKVEKLSSPRLGGQGITDGDARDARQ